MNDTRQQPCEAQNSIEIEALRYESLTNIQRAIRSGQYCGKTAGLAPGFLQGNLVILPSTYALDFFRFCQRNPKPCPLVGVSDTGVPHLVTLGKNLDIRTAIPQYNIYRDGELKEQRIEISDLWANDMVAFVLGCSFSFEEALIAEGISIRHIDDNKTVSMFRTNLDTIPAGPFEGKMVVSMRPMKTVDAIRACAVTARFPHAHGKPVHIGDPAQIGITDIDSPDWGDPTRFETNDVPVFWACGVTPQAVIQSAKPSICITHTPSHMLITNIPSWNRVGLIHQP